MIIGITDTEASYPNYLRWVQGGDEAIKVITLTPENRGDLDNCEGIVLSGGVDTHPRFYRSENTHYPNAPAEFDEKRDQFELDVFRYTCERKLPLLAICRGMQLVNIALGGNMIQDLEAGGKNNHRKNGSTDGMHPVSIATDSLLYQIAGLTIGKVNSAHHQGLGYIASDLFVNAWSSDGLVEGVEWKSKSGRNFFLGVQWHPERLGDVVPGNPLSKNIREAFLQAEKLTDTR